jgi:primosomal protein N' (replication factor Y)
MRTIAKILFAQPLISRENLKLVEKITDYYFNSFSQNLFRIIPIPVKRKVKIEQKLLKIPQNLDLIEPQIVKYQQLIRQKINQNQQTILIIPDLLLAQIYFQNLKEHFETILFYSQQSQALKFENYLKILAGEADLVIGTMQTIFAPLPNLGQIIIEQEQDRFYKLEQKPYFDIQKIAQMIKNLKNCAVEIVSPAPSLESILEIQKGNFHWLRLKSDLEPKIIDINVEKQFSQNDLLTDSLQEKLDQNLKNQKTNLLYFNYKGNRKILFCPDCHHNFFCEKCQRPQSFHPKSKILYCPFCNNRQNLPDKCPICQNPNLTVITGGIKKLVKQISFSFPKAKIQIIAKGQNRRVKNPDIVIGTKKIFYQLFQKYDFVAALLPELSFNQPDFRAAETTFCDLSQLALFAKSDFWIQTSMPENSIFEFLNQSDILPFYRKEYYFRQKFSYPPASEMVKLLLKTENSEKGMKSSEKLIEKLKLSKEKIIGPKVFQDHTKQRINYAQIIIKDNDLSTILPKIPQNWKIIRNPKTI